MLYLVLFYLGICMSSSVKTADHWSGEKYHHNSAVQFQVGQKMMDNIEFKGTEKILDVGCGDGKTSEYCVQKLHDGLVVGIDSSQDMINFAKKKYGSVQNLSFNHMDVTEMKYENQFDYVYSLFCLHWVKKQKMAIYNICRALKSGGKAFMYVAHENDLSKQIAGAAQKAFALHPELVSKHQQSMFYQTVDVWKEWIEDAGGVVQECSVSHQTKMFSSVQKMKDFVSTLNVEPNLSEDERSIFLDAVFKELYKLNGLSAGDSFPFKMTTLVLEVSKPE